VREIGRKEGKEGKDGRIEEKEEGRKD